MARLKDLPSAAAHLGVSTWTIRDLIWSGQLPYVHFGRKHYVTTEDLDALVERLKTVEGSGRIAGQARHDKRKPLKS